MNKVQVKKLSKLIFTETKERPERIEKFLQTLKKGRSSSSQAILENLEKLVVRNEKQNRLNIESAFELNKGTTKKINDRFEKILGKKLKPEFKENKSLVGGLRISNADFVWENSILSNLEQLKGAINQ